MALIWVPDRRIRRDFKPDFPLELRDSRHLVGVSELVLPELRKTLIQGHECVPLSGPVANTVGDGGRGIELDATTLNGLIIGTADVIFGTGSCTIFIVRRSKDTVARQSTLFGYDNGSNNRILVHGPWSDNNIYFDYGDATYGRISTSFIKTTNVETLVFVGDSGGKGREIWRNGVLIAKNAADLRPTATTANVKLGTASDTAGTSDLEEIYLFGVAQRAWTDDEIIQWSAHPYKTFFKPRQKQIWVGVSTANNLEGAATESDSSSGDLSTAIQLGGSALESDSASADATTAISLDGSSLETDTAGAGLSTSIPLEGSATETDGTTGALSTGAGLEGVASESDTGSANLSTNIDLKSGASESDIAGAGLTTGLSLSGAATENDIAGAILSTGAGLEGIASEVDTAAASLTTSIATGGAALESMTGAGDLTTKITLEGIASETDSAGGGITTSISVQGDALAVDSAIGDVDTAINLSGSSSESIISGADLTVIPNPEVISIVKAAGVFNLIIKKQSNFNTITKKTTTLR